MAFQPDDDRFYDALTGAGRDYQKYRDKVAEDQAASTRELGQIYGQALPNTVNAAMKGADWSMKRGMDQQKMDLAASEEGRAGTKFGWETTEANDKLAQLAKTRDYEAAPATEEEAAMAGLKYQPGMTHEALKQASDVQGWGKDMRDLEFKKTEEGGRNTRSADQLKSEEKRAAATLGGENTRAAASQEGEEKRLTRRLAAEKEIEGLKLAAPKTPKTAPAELIAKMGDADAAEKALTALGKEWQDKAGGKFAGMAQFVPGTDASRYNDAKDVYAQQIGKFLEEGKMSDVDLANYKDMMPKPTDSPERAAERLTRLSAAIAAKKESHITALQGAGYDLGTIQAGNGGGKFDFKHKAPANGVAYGDEAGANLAPADLQAAMVAKANAPKGPKPLHKMTIEEKKAELRARGINPDE